MPNLRGLIVDTVDYRAAKPARIIATFSDQLLLELDAQYANKNKLKNIRAAIQVLAHPLHFYKNTRQWGDGFDAYCGRPKFRYDLPGGPQPFPDDLVYVVYVDSRFFVHDFGFEVADPDDNTHVNGHEDRFGQTLWTRH